MRHIDRSIIFYGITIFLYFILIILLPANSIVMANYDLSPDQYRTLLFVLALPSVAIWYAAFLGYGRLSQYAALIRGSDEGVQFTLLTRAVGWLAWSLPATAISLLLLNSLASSAPDFRSTAIIIGNYVTLALPLIGFYLLRRSSHGLSGAVQNSSPTGHLKAKKIVVFTVIGAAYCIVMAQNIDLENLSSTINPYYLPSWLVVISIVLPSLISWWIGVSAAFEIASSSKMAAGHIYRRALRLLAYGVVAVVFSSVALQYATAVTPRTGYVTLNSHLISTYVIRGISAAGYIMIAVAAIRLKKIEEV